MSEHKQIAPGIVIVGDTEAVSEDDKKVVEFIGQLIRQHYPDTDALFQSLMNSVHIQMCVLRGAVDASALEQLKKDLTSMANHSGSIDVIKTPEKAVMH